MTSKTVWFFFIAGMIGALCFLLGSFVFSGKPLTPPTPDLIEDASANGGGWWSGGCPPPENAKGKWEEAGSPEIEERLKKEFPAGTSALRLQNKLLAVGFKLTDACENDASIHRASFRQTGGGFFGPYPAFSLVAWKIDARGKIVWTKAAIAFTGP